MATRHGTDSPPLFRRSRWFLGFLLFAAVSIYMLFTEHRAHYFSALPLVLLLACTLLHVLMHRDVPDHEGHDPRKPANPHDGARP
jgi:hypothetical protein